MDNASCHRSALCKQHQRTRIEYNFTSIKEIGNSIDPLVGVLSPERILLQTRPKKTAIHRTNHSLSQKVHRKMIPLYSDTFCYRIPYYIHLCKQLLFNSLFFNISPAPNFFRNYLRRLPIWPLFEILRNTFKILVIFFIFFP